MDQSFKLTRGKGSYLYTSDDQRFFDLVNGFGSVFLGHCDEPIVQAARAQTERLWSLGRLPGEVSDQASARTRSLLAPELTNVFFYSTGMESIEFSLRLAIARTGRHRFIGFSNSMHGKSIATANLGWDNNPLQCDPFVRLPFPNAEIESELMAKLGRCLDRGDIAAIVIEPVQGSWQGDALDPEFLAEVGACCKQRETLLILDETLTGLYRTGPRFYYEPAAIQPDILVFAKSIGNGFPASVVATDIDDTYWPRALPGSTFSGSPLACAIIDASLRQFELRIDSSQIADIEAIVRSALSTAKPDAFTLKGKGALWILTFASIDAAVKFQQVAYDNRILLTRFGQKIRLLPQAEVDLDELERACHLLAKAL